MQTQHNPPEMIAHIHRRAQTLRQSAAYPALMGSVAGGIAGALMAIVIAKRIAGRDTSREAVAPREHPREPARFDLSVRDLVQLAMLVASLAKQVRVWLKERSA